MILLVQGRKIDIDDKGRMDAKKLKKMIETDLTQGLIPIMVFLFTITDCVIT